MIYIPCLCIDIIFQEPDDGITKTLDLGKIERVCKLFHSVLFPLDTVLLAGGGGVRGQLCFTQSTMI